jgi:hypothetical protein
LVDSRALQIVKAGYELLKSSIENVDGGEMPVNRDVGSNADLLLRNLDCSVIQMVHQFRKINCVNTIQSEVYFSRESPYIQKLVSEKRTISRFVLEILIALKVSLVHLIHMMVIMFLK